MLTAEARKNILSIRPREVYNGVLIPDALDTIYSYAAGKQDRVSLPALPDFMPTLLQLRDYAFLARLLQEVQDWLTLFLFTMLYRVVAQVDDIAAAFDHQTFFRIPTATRALLELLLLLHNTYRQIYERNKQARASSEIELAIAEELGIRELLLRQVRATRINWHDPFGNDWDQVSDDCRQINVLSMISKLPQDVEQRVQRWYAILSDFCHPNFGSVLYVLDHDSIDSRTSTVVASRSPGTRSQLEMTVDLLSAPLAFACLQTTSFFNVLDKLRAHYQEGVERFAGRDA